MTHWSKEPPTEPGWYWERVSAEGVRVFLVEVYALTGPDEETVLQVAYPGNEQSYDFNSYSEWQRVEPPKE